jgi:hypothetical protein
MSEILKRYSFWTERVLCRHNDADSANRFSEPDNAMLSCQSSGTDGCGQKPFCTGSQVKSNSGYTIGQ